MGSKKLTDAMVAKMEPPASGQAIHWDSKQTGLALLIGAGGAKTFRSHYRLNGKQQSRTIGRFGELVAEQGGNANVEWAREQTRLDRIAARQGIDPKRPLQEEAPAALTFKDVLAQFIERHCQPRQRTWAETKRLLTVNCAAWMDRPIDEISEADAHELLDAYVKAGKGPTATTTLAWLRTMWRFAGKRKLVADPHLMLNVDNLAYEKGVRDRVYSADEIAAIWRAADRLTKIEGAYFKLLLLLAPRKSALAGMRWKDLDDPDAPTLWTTPFQLTKSRKTAKPRVYITPLPTLAQSIIASLPRENEQLCFPSGIIDSLPLSAGSPLRRKLIKHGGPKDFAYHVCRHTIASHFSNASDFEVGLLLNHASSGVTAGYRHGNPGFKLKLDMLTEWADHIASIVAPEPSPGRLDDASGKPEGVPAIRDVPAMPGPS